MCKLFMYTVFVYSYTNMQLRLSSSYLRKPHSTLIPCSQRLFTLYWCFISFRRGIKTNQHPSLYTSFASFPPTTETYVFLHALHTTPIYSLQVFPTVLQRRQEYQHAYFTCFDIPSASTVAPLSFPAPVYPRLFSPSGAVQHGHLDE